MTDGSCVREPEPAPMSPVSKNGYPGVSAPTLSSEDRVTHNDAMGAPRETTMARLPPAIVRDATEETKGRQVRVRPTRTHHSLANVKKAVLFKRQIAFFVVSLLASIVALTDRASTSIVPEALESIFFTMQFLQKDDMLASHMSDNEAYLLRFLADHVVGIMMFSFGLFVAWVGVQGTRGSKCSLELFKAIMTTWVMISMLTLTFTLYTWTLMPVFQELLPRCDAATVCMPYGSLTLPSDTQACIQQSPTQFHRLPRECDWTQKYFLQSCHHAAPGSSRGYSFPDIKLVPTSFADNNIVTVLFTQRRQLVEDTPTDLECSINYPLMDRYHQFIDQFALYLGRATLAFWSVAVVLVLNVVSSMSCLYSACQFEDLQHENNRRRLVRDIHLHGQIPNSGRTSSAERRMPLLSDDCAMHV